VTVAGSLGLAVFPEHGRDPATLMQHADQAMYRAKREGRSRCEFYKDVL
jgi:diguanylate cyclase (GGDEF)-like protein